MKVKLMLLFTYLVILCSCNVIVCVILKGDSKKAYLANCLVSMILVCTILGIIQGNKI